MSDRLASRTVGAELTLSPHDSVHKDFARYEELMGWLKELDREKYTQMKRVSVINYLLKDFYNWFVASTCSILIAFSFAVHVFQKLSVIALIK